MRPLPSAQRAMVSTTPCSSCPRRVSTVSPSACTSPTAGPPAPTAWCSGASGMLLLFASSLRFGRQSVKNPLACESLQVAQSRFIVASTFSLASSHDAIPSAQRDPRRHAFLGPHFILALWRPATAGRLAHALGVTRDARLPPSAHQASPHPWYLATCGCCCRGCPVLPTAEWPAEVGALGNRRAAWVRAPQWTRRVGRSRLSQAAGHTADDGAPGPESQWT